MAGFSGVMKIQDLDDFITPSQECIKPVPIEKSSSSKKTKIQVETDGSYVEVDDVGSRRTLATASITLNDCLACSGCVTSAESVLIEQQSHLEIKKALESKLTGNNEVQLVVMSISPQSRASIAAKYKLSAQSTAEKLHSVLTKMGADYVLDTTSSRNLSLIASAKEVVEKLSKSNSDGGTSSTSDSWPVLSSACPGWICYAEKSHGAKVLNHISRARSPQAIMGALVKNYLADKLGISPPSIFHATVMPCFDKKLEASRDDFLVPGTSCRETDCVISTAELMLFFEENSIDFSNAECLPFLNFKFLSGISSPLDCLYNHTGGGSGGYADYIFKSLAKQLTHESVEEIDFKILRNKDFQEAKLERGGKVILSVAKAYGFRNIQNLVQKLKRNKSAYHYVEVMACPSGCLNGGGQIRWLDDEGLSQPQLRDEMLQNVTSSYDSLDFVDPANGSSTNELISEWLGDLDSDKAQRYLFTNYHEVEKSDFTMNIKW